MRRVYEHFGDELEADAEQAMTRCLAGNRQGVHGTHTYRLRDLGLDRAELGSRFGSYGQRHNIPLEPIE